MVQHAHAAPHIFPVAAMPTALAVFTQARRFIADVFDQRVLHDSGGRGFYIAYGFGITATHQPLDVAFDGVGVDVVAVGFADVTEHVLQGELLAYPNGCPCGFVSCLHHAALPRGAWPVKNGWS